MEFYPNIEKGDAITVGVFYKDILNPIERINNSNRYYSQFPVITYQNAASATVKGLEVELRKSLDFIPLGLFRNLSFAGNASIIESKATFEPEILTGTITERPLQGQAPWLLNAGLYYDNAGWGSKMGIIYNYVAESIYAAAKGGTYFADTGDGFGPEYRGSLFELPRHILDFSCTQRDRKRITNEIHRTEYIGC